MENYSAPKGDIDLLLIGKTGNGKSATGNTILGRKAFKSVPNSTSVTKTVQSDYSRYNGRVIKVVDGPGVGDTDMNEAEALRQVLQCIEQSISANPEGYHGILLVVRFGGRFTVEDSQTVSILKGIFGDDFVKKYCILLVTCGDNFDPEEAETDSFESWCLSQKGVFRNLVEECNRRVILFDNRTKDMYKKAEQLDKLLSMVDSLSALGLRYSGEHFKMAQRNRDRLMVESKVPVIKEECFRETSLIIQQLTKVQLVDVENQLGPLEELMKSAENLLESVSKQDKGTGALIAVIRNVEHVKQCVEEQMKSARLSIDMKRENEIRRKEMERLREEKEQRMREADEEKRAELERKIAQIESENRENLLKMKEMESAIRKKTMETEEEYRAVKENEMISVFVKIGNAILDYAVPMLLSFLSGLSSRGKSDDSDDDDDEGKTRRADGKRAKGTGPIIQEI